MNKNLIFLLIFYISNLYVCLHFTYSKKDLDEIHQMQIHQIREVIFQNNVSAIEAIKMLIKAHTQAIEDKKRKIAQIEEEIKANEDLLEEYNKFLSELKE